jgi:histidinol-phosphatase
VVVGVSAAAEYGERAWAVRGAGAFLAARGGAPVRLRVSGASAFGPDCALSTGTLRSLAASPARWVALADLVRRCGRTRGYGDFLHYHLLARGAIDLVLESDVHVLDIAALSLVVSEAGGVFTDLEGRAINLETRSVLAGPALLHAQALAMMQA